MDYPIAYVGAFISAIWAGKYINNLLQIHRPITYLATIITCIILVKGSYIFASFFLVNLLVLFIIFIMSLISGMEKSVWHTFDTKYQDRIVFEGLMMSFMDRNNYSPSNDKFRQRRDFAEYMAKIMVSDKYYSIFDRNDFIGHLFRVLSIEAKNANLFAESFLYRISHDSTKKGV